MYVYWKFATQIDESFINIFGGESREETLFIDEGFGTLDDKSLHQAIDILLELNDGTKSIGIISHVQELKDIIPTKLVVTKSTDGSKVKIVS